MGDLAIGTARRRGRPDSPFIPFGWTVAVAFAVLPALFVSDIILGASRMAGIDLALTPGVVLRGGLFAVSLGYLLLQLRWIVARDALLLLSVLLAGLFGPLYALVAGGSVSDFLGDLQSLSKVLYWPVIAFAGALWFYGRRVLEPLFLVRFTEMAFYALGLSLLAMNATGLTQATYGEYAYGTKGMFHSQNDISLVMGISLCAAVYMTLHNTNHVRVALLVLSMYALALIGTRASLIAILVGSPAVYVWVLVERRTSRMSMIRGATLALVAGIGLILAANIGMLVLERMSQFEYSRQKLEFQLPRQYLYEIGLEYLTERPMPETLIGEGARRYEEGVGSKMRFGPSNGRKAVEVDWLDLIGAYGVVFTILVYWLFFVLALRCLRLIRQSRDGIAGLHLIMFALFLGHGVLAGHALVSPIVGTVVGLAAARYVRVRGDAMARRRTIGIQPAAPSRLY